MAQALLVLAVCAGFVVFDTARMKKEKAGAKPFILYFLLLAVSLSLILLSFFNVELPDPQKAIVEAIKGMGVS